MAHTSVAQASFPHDIPAEPDECTALIAELIAEEGITQIEAMSQAVALLDELPTYASSWDSWAFNFGNLDANILD